MLHFNSVIAGIDKLNRISFIISKSANGGKHIRNNKEDRNITTNFTNNLSNVLPSDILNDNWVKIDSYHNAKFVCLGSVFIF